MGGDKNNLEERQKMQSEQSDSVIDDELDYVIEEAGQFSKYQIGHLVLMVLPIALSGLFGVNYIVTSATDEYRCQIPDCDTDTTYQQNWLSNAIPYKPNSKKWQKCARFKLKTDFPNGSVDDVCSAAAFDRSQIVQCDQFVFKTTEHRIMKEFGIYCDANEYKLALVGSMYNFGAFIFMPIGGMLSDKFGRLTLTAIATFLGAIVGIFKAFSTTYTMFMFFEFLGAAISSSVYLASFILVIEWLPAKYRLYAASAVTSLFAVGEMSSGILAILFPHYRTYLLAVYVPGLIVLAYLWLLPESIRWLHASGHYSRALRINKNVAKHNKRTISDKSLEILLNRPDQSADDECGGCIEKQSSSILVLFRCRDMIARLMICAFIWCLMCFVYYGIGIRATKFDGDDNKYVTYITTVSAEIPAALSSYFILNCVSRKTALISTSLNTSACLLLSCILPSDWTTLIRVCYFISMMSIASVSAVLCVFTAELWPTPLRSTLMNICSMFGRIGPMMAPLAVVLLSQISPSLPVYTFAVAGILLASLVFLLPETKGQKLPETLDDARNL